MINQSQAPHFSAYRLKDAPAQPVLSGNGCERPQKLIFSPFELYKHRQEDKLVIPVVWEKHDRQLIQIPQPGYSVKTQVHFGANHGRHPS